MSIDYPYLPPYGHILYVPSDNQFMIAAKEHARLHSLDDTMPNASLVVKDGVVIGRGANGSDFHKTNECVRIKLKSKTGEDYELCEGCHPKNHSEPTAIADAVQAGHDTQGAVIYLWGHWWCCEPCWVAMKDAGITTVYLLEGSEKLFNKESSEHVIGRQFE